VAQALAVRGIVPSIVWTGQHPGLNPGEYGFGARPIIWLGCAGQEDPHDHVRAVASALYPLLGEGPDLLIVQGDTSSALGGALAGFTAAIPVAHVEAGLRSGDLASPWPEEEYRAAIDAQADLLFAPTEGAAANLQSENVPGEIVVTGNTGIDALLQITAHLPAVPARKCRTKRLLVTCHRRESWGERMRSIAFALGRIASDAVRVDVLLHPNPRLAQVIEHLLGGTPGIRLLAPSSHAHLIDRMRGYDLILSDSGGIQEEAPALGIPLLVLRDRTERPEAIATGNMRLVGTGAGRIIAEVEALLADPVALAAMARPAFPYGDGQAAPRIAAHVEQWLLQRLPAERRAS
jgi:UDP-N-acetylglucosamine 2-epimerase (non-hydrolysing)